MPFECQKCGACCRSRTIEVSHGDIKRWWTERRYDILREISWVNNYPKKDMGGFYVALTVRKEREPCVFLLGNSLCGIYETRPRACRDAPCGYDKFPECPAFRREDTTPLKRGMVRKGQSKDLKRAFFNQSELFGLLVEARRRFDGARRTMGKP